VAWLTVNQLSTIISEVRSFLVHFLILPSRAIQAAMAPPLAKVRSALLARVYLGNRVIFCLLSDVSCPNPSSCPSYRLTVDESDGNSLKQQRRVFSVLPGDEIFSLSRISRSGRSKTSESRSSSKSSSSPERGRSTLSLTSLRDALSCSNSEAEDVEPTAYLVIRDTEPEKYCVSWTIRI
jgi:hypothetical protein